MDNQIDSIIEVLLSPDNQRRTEAQNYISSIPQTNFEGGVTAFLNAMNSQNLQIASMSCLLLKKHYLENKQNINKLTIQQLQGIANSTFTLMTTGKQFAFLKRCCEIIVKVYCFVKKSDGLINVIGHLNNAQTQPLKLALLYFIQISCQFAFTDQTLMSFSDHLISIFSRELQSQSNQIRIATFKTLTVFLSSISQENHMKKFNPLLKDILNKAIELIKFDQQSGTVALQSLNQLVQSHPKFIKPIFQDLLLIYTQIMETSQLIFCLRSTAMSGILMLAMHHHTLLRKNAHFKSRMVPSYMRMLSQIQSTSVQQWAQQLQDQIMSKNDISMATEQHIAQISVELGNKFMLPLFIPYIQQGLASNQIKYQHASLTALALLVQNCHQNYKNQLKNMIGLMVPLLQTQNPRIIYDILIAMGYMCAQFAPQIQIHFGNMILTFITQSLQHPMKKIQFKAAQCIVNFQQTIGQNQQAIKVTSPFLPNILSTLVSIFQQSLGQSNYIMLQSVLEAIGAIASINDFSQYYSSFMPGMIKIVTSIPSDTPQKLSIKSKAIVAMGDLLSSVKNSAIFGQQCPIIMQSLISLQSQLADDDTLHKAIFVVYGDIVEVIKQNFNVYSDYIFQMVFKAALRNASAQILDQTQTGKLKANPLHQYASIKLDLKVDGVKNIVLNTDLFEQKLQATNLLSLMAQNMGPSFLKYGQKTLQIIKQLINFSSSKQMRKNIITTCKYLVLCGSNNQQKSSIINQLDKFVIQGLTNSIRCKDHKQVQLYSDYFNQAMPFMNQQMIEALPQKLGAMLVMVKQIVKQIQKIYSEKDMDDDLTEEMNNETSQVQQCLEYIEQMVKRGKGIPAFDNLRKCFPSDYQFDE